MNKIIFCLCLVATTSLSAEVVKQTIIPSESIVSWTGKKVTGQHSGTVQVKSGTVEIEDDQIVGGTFDVDLTSLKVTDLTDPKDNAKLVGHLKSDDFFKVSTYPTAKFTITKAVKLSPAAASADGSNYEITGDLEILGVKNPVTFPAKIALTSDKATAMAKIALDRTKWNLKYGSGKFFTSLGDKMIYDEFNVELSVASKTV